MNQRNDLRPARIITAGLSRLHAAMLLALPGPVGCLLYSGRVDEQVCRLYLAGILLFFFAAASELAARKTGTLPAYMLCCVLAAAAVFSLAHLAGSLLLLPAMKTILLLETGFGILLLSAAGAQGRMREKRRRKAMEENDITWKDTPVMLEKPSFFGVLFFAAAYLLSAGTNCPAFCDLLIRAGIVYALVLLVYSYLQGIFSSFLEYRHLTNVPFVKILRLHMLTLAGLAVLLCLSAVPALLTGRFRSYTDIRDWKGTQVIPNEDMLFPEMENPLPEIIPHPDIEKGEYHPAPAWYKPAGYLLAGLAVLFFAVMILKAVRDYARFFRGRVEENGDISYSLTEDEAVPVRMQARRSGGENTLTGREKIRRTYRRTIRRYRRRGDLPSPAQTPSGIEADTPFPEGFDVASLHKSYIEARYGK